jgi:hypothetical protein
MATFIQFGTYVLNLDHVVSVDLRPENAGAGIEIELAIPSVSGEYEGKELVRRYFFGNDAKMIGAYFATDGSVKSLG